MAEEKETTEQQAEQADLEVEEEQAEEVEGGAFRRGGADRTRKSRGSPGR